MRSAEVSKRIINMHLSPLDLLSIFLFECSICFCCPFLSFFCVFSFIWLMIVIIITLGSKRRDTSQFSVRRRGPCWGSSTDDHHRHHPQMSAWHCLWNFGAMKKNKKIKLEIFEEDVVLHSNSFAMCLTGAQWDWEHLRRHVNVIREGRNVHIVKWMVSLIMG